MLVLTHYRILRLPAKRSITRSGCSSGLLNCGSAGVPTGGLRDARIVGTPVLGPAGSGVTLWSWACDQYYNAPGQALQSATGLKIILAGRSCRITKSVPKW